MPTEGLIGPTQLKDAYRRVRDRIHAAAERSGRRASDVQMVAVTKYAGPDQIRTLVEMGHAELGESKVQQLAQRVAMLEEFLGRKKTLAGAAPRASVDGLPEKVRWHMVGHLQRNKVKQVLPLVGLIHSVDSLRLAEEIHNYAARADVVTDILIQVNVTGEPTKSGVAGPAVIHLAEQIDTMMHLRLRGLMTMGPNTDNPEDARPAFARTAEILADIRKEKIGGNDCNILSMGMSDDLEIAIEEGANVLRIGRALFGEPQGEI
jgi:pyridoxal phosphate enzyme (YggS family)